MLLLLLLLIQPQTTQNTYTKTIVQFTPSRTQLALCVFSATNTHKFRPREGDATKPASIRKWRANSMRSTINKTQKKIVNQEKKHKNILFNNNLWVQAKKKLYKIPTIFSFWSFFRSLHSAHWNKQMKIPKSQANKKKLQVH